MMVAVVKVDPHGGRDEMRGDPSRSAELRPRADQKYCFVSRLDTFWVRARSLWQQQNAADNEDCDDQRREWTAKRKAAIAHGLIYKISNGGT